MQIPYRRLKLGFPSLFPPKKSWWNVIKLIFVCGKYYSHRKQDHAVPKF